jgi:SAM-dependent methyltransferase
MSMRNHQELLYSENYDYRVGSPHLTHHHLYQGLLARLREARDDVVARGLPLTLLEIGAGDGGLVEPALAYGFRVTATEMSRPSIAGLEERYGANPAFAVFFDEDGALTVLGERRFSVILCASVLHHIPDYLATIETAVGQHLDPGGAFVSFQDPLWYPSMGKGSSLLNRGAYLSWRLTQGNYGRGLKTRLRRLRHEYDEDNPSDMVEYHAMRQGVDHQRIVATLSERFEDVSLISYWSTQSGFWQRVGERLGAKTTFAIVARGYRG